MTIRKALRTVAVPVVLTGAATLAALVVRTGSADGALRPLGIAVAVCALFVGGRAATLALALALAAGGWIVLPAMHVGEAEARLADLAGFAVTGGVLIACIVVARRREAAAWRRARAAQQASAGIARRFRTLFELAPVGLAITEDVAYARAELNPALRRLLGLGDVPSDATRPAPSVTLRRQGVRVPPDAFPLHRAATTGRPVDGEEYEIERPDGRVVHVVASARPLRDRDGVVRGAVSAWLDVTARRAAERAHEESERRFRSVVESNMLGIVFADPATARVIDANDAFLRLVGRTRDDLARGAVNWIDATAPEYVAHERHMARVMRPGDVATPYEKDFVRPDGTRVPALIGGTQVADDCFIGFVVDQTDRRAAEARLRESEARLDLAQTAGGVGVFDWDMVLDRLVWTRQLCGLFGLAPEEFSGHLDAWVRRIPAEDARDITALVRQAVAERREDLVFEFRVTLPDGGLRWLSARAKLFYTPEGTPQRMIGVNHDVSDRHRYEEALRDGDRRKDEFLAMLAHELRNPLGPIRNAVQLLALLGPQEPPLIAARELIDRQVSHLARLIDDLLDVSRITRGTIVLRREVVELGAAVAQAVEQARPLVDARRHVLTVRTPEVPVHLEADPARLVQIVANLLANAAKYTEPGGRIAIDVERTDAAAVIRVRDSGLGISPELLPRVFDLFVQEQASLDRSQGGLGIGLTLVRSLVELHGGRVEAESAGPGLGSEFRVVLPAPGATAAVPAPPATRPPVRRATPGLRVLVVEDNHDARESFVALLQLAGHTVRSAADGLAALDVVHGFTPDVAFLDLGLPGLDGYALARRLRDEEALRDTLLVAVSGYGRAEDKHAALAAGFDEHLTKPVDFARIDDLLAMLAPRVAAAVEPPADAPAPALH